MKLTPLCLVLSAALGCRVSTESPGPALAEPVEPMPSTAGSQFSTVSVDGLGGPGQALEILDRAAAVPTLSVEVRTNDGIESWQRVDELSAAGPDDKVFVVVAVEGGPARVHFGDGAHGAVPPAGERRFRVRYADGGDVGEDGMAVRALPGSGH